MLPDFQRRLERVFALAESVGQPSQLLADLDKLCKSLHIPATVIDGMAVAAHGYARFTADVDLLVGRDDAAKLANALLAIGWDDLGQNRLRSAGSRIEINLCAAGVRAGRTLFPAPENQDSGVAVASLPLLLVLKLSANRHKDRTDFIELVKANGLTSEYLEVNVAPRLPGALDRQLARKLWQMAQDELAQ